jgi:hypothetical protein
MTLWLRGEDSQEGRKDGRQRKGEQERERFRIGAETLMQDPPKFFSPSDLPPFL